MEKSAGIQLELKDLDTSKRTAIIRHAVYTSIDRVKDISTKGMFTKSWQENKPDFLFNHVTGATVGSVINTYDDDNGAYTEVKFGNWTLGNDVLEMASEGVLKGASFGYISDKNKTDYVQIKGQKIRRLKEVKHIETSLLTVLPAHPEAGVMVLNKSLEQIELKQLKDSEKQLLQTLISNDISNMASLINVASTLDITSDLYTWIMYQISRRADWTDSSMSKLYYNQQAINGMKANVASIEAYCSKANASDETIVTLQNSLTEYKQIITDYDTALTSLATKPGASDESNEIANFLNSLNIEIWKKQSLSNSRS
jgi:HK97 family phage prohead protease